jgi:hypothetical protein
VREGREKENACHWRCVGPSLFWPFCAKECYRTFVSFHFWDCILDLTTLPFPCQSPSPAESKRRLLP